MISLKILFSILIIHWFADYFCQTHEQSIKKSSSNFHLFMHVYTYSLVWYVATLIYSVVYNNPNMILLVLITSLCHYVTDWFTSRWVKRLFTKQDIHNGFVVIGIDQFLHYAQLILTYELLK